MKTEKQSQLKLQKEMNSKLLVSGEILPSPSADFPCIVDYERQDLEDKEEYLSY